MAWALGAGLLAKEVEGDPERDAVVEVRDQKVNTAPTHEQATRTRA